MLIVKEQLRLGQLLILLLAIHNTPPYELISSEGNATLMHEVQSNLTNSFHIGSCAGLKVETAAPRKSTILSSSPLTIAFA